MKLINSTFTLNGVRISIAQVQDNTHEADINLKAFIGAVSNGGTPRDVSHNVVIFGVDGPGESLNKIKATSRKVEKLIPPKKKKPIKK